MKKMFLLSLMICSSVWAAETSAQTNLTQKAITISLIGDSTVTNNVGWGKAFAGRFNSEVRVLNFAKGGASSKSWNDGKRLAAALEAKPDYVFIQFGHNDQPGKGAARETLPATSYRDNLKDYVKEVEASGAKAVIVSSVTRRTFAYNGKISPSLAPYAAAAKALAEELDVRFIGLHKASVNHHNEIGYEASMTFNPKEGDTSHFNEKGAEAVTDLILTELKEVDPALAAHLK
jgi:lysophospholipase L1-like esterase